MVDLSNQLMGSPYANHYNVKIEEWMKYGGALEYNNGNNQRIIHNSVPAQEMDISYQGLTRSQFETLVSAYENNHAETVIIYQSWAAFDDIRNEAFGVNTATWVFKEFKFNVVAPQTYSGHIKLISSVFFNLTKYQNEFSDGQTSSYSPVTSTDTSFTTVLNTAQPNKVEFEYVTNSNASAIGQSARHIADKGGLRKMWQLSWHLSQTDFTTLLTFYRKKGGIMGQFGMPLKGANGMGGSSAMTNAAFLEDSFKFEKLLDNRYVCKAKIVELL